MLMVLEPHLQAAMLYPAPQRYIPDLTQPSKLNEGFGISRQNEQDVLEAVKALQDWTVLNNRSLSNSSRVAHMLEVSVFFLLEGAEEVAHSLLSAGRVAQQCCMTGSDVNGFAISTLLEKFSHT